MKIWMKRFRGRALGAARVACYLFVAALVLSALGARTVYGDFAEASLHAGRELDGLSDVLADTKTVFVNGAAMNIATAFTPRTPREVLDRFEQVCRAHPDAMVRALADIPTTLLEKAKANRSVIPRIGVVRKEAGDDGVLACFTSERTSSVKELLAHVAAFEQSLDLSEFGHFRYVYVRRTPKGTHVRTLWTDGPIELGKMFPATGDAEGIDPSLVPRPPSARRILSGTCAQVTFGVHVYESTESRPSVASFYEREMNARGWKRAGEAGDETRRTTSYLKDGALSFVQLADTDSGGAMVTVTEAPARDAPATVRVRVEP